MISDLLSRLWRRSPAAPATEFDGALENKGSPKLPSNSAPVADTDGLNPGKPAQTDPLSRREVILSTAVNPALGWLSVRNLPSDDRARVMLLAIAGQESDAQYRRQHGNGPARGLWQFESGGGVRGVLMHRSSARLAAALCEWRGVKAETPIVHKAMEVDDVLAAGFARLLLWTDPQPLPDDERTAWAYYLRNWRPGKPHRDRWPENWRLAREAVEG